MKYFAFKDLLITKNAKIRKLGISLVLAALTILLLTAFFDGYFDNLLRGFNEAHASLTLAALMGVLGGVFVFKPDVPDRVRSVIGKIFGVGVDGNLNLKELSFASKVFDSLMKRGKIWT
jgi:hypothetical protein